MTESAVHEGQTWSLQKFLRLTKKEWNAYSLDTNSLCFWLIYHQRSNDIPPTINGQGIGRVSAAISTKISADSRLICRPSLGRYLGWCIGDTSTDTSRSTCWQTLDWYIDRHSAAMSTDTLVECWLICWLRVFLKESMRLKWNFQRGGGGGWLKLKIPLWKGYGYFLEQHIVSISLVTNIKFHHSPSIQKKLRWTQH